ncbi:glycosyltransferase family 4 protein [Candidatus Atelocyanobacterium thalassae]|uniref:D-inositol-3-phosphate glycosyltransferase n=1 Tax=cyanobacterium endosymbiont of Braarudosphaera bigelowii TaxID=1285375 RepID=A0ABM7UDN0_9CHRO|nr:glycosyltransferase family 1 protein [Candidatus Atelocyanobacterium thalassa]BDA40252.1 D-inositol-3-phosphate glycosyltransferase [cyanobacterium endosymbiont of Braarudosphaera bigelowii]
MIKVYIDATSVRNKPTGIGFYTINLINELYYLENTSDLNLNIYFHPSLKNWLSRNFLIPKLLEQYLKVLPLNIPVSLADLLAKYSPFILFCFRNNLGDIDLIHGADHYIYPHQQAKKVITIHDLTFLKFPKYSTKIVKSYTKRIKQCLKWTDAIITFSENTKQDIVDFFNVDPNVIYIIPQASRYSNNYLTPQILTKCIVSIEKHLHSPYFLFVSTLEPRKNILNLIKAFEYLKINYSIPHKLILIGKKGWDYNSIIDYINKSTFKEDIQHLDYISDQLLAVFYSQAEAFIYPSFYEGFGLPILEAMTLGSPVITSNTSSLPEVAGNAALYVDPYDYYQLAKMMLKILNNPDLRKEMISRGKQQANNFSWKNTALKTLNAYKSVLSKSKKL